MKSIAILFLSFLVFATITTSVHCTTDPPNPTKEVRDTDGNLIRVETKYYILPFEKKYGGGLSLRNTTSNESYPLGIFQEDEDDENFGIPVSFYPVSPKKSVVRVSTDLNIEFSESPVDSGNSNIWKVDNYNRNPKIFYISPGGTKGNPGSDTINSWFKIEEFEKGYKLVHCPSVLDNEDNDDDQEENEIDDEEEIVVKCKDIGLIKYNGQQRLALSDTPFRVVFRKA